MTISVTTIRLCHEAYVGDSRLLAYFDLRIEGVADIKGCALVQTKKHGLSVWSPPCERKHNEPERGIKFSNAMRKAVIRVAKDAYDNFTAHRTANAREVSAVVALVREIEERDAA